MPGGGWIAGSKDGIANYLKVLASHGYTTVGVEYSTGLGAAYPKPVEQVNAALGHLVRNAAELNIDPEAIVLAGDSAGALITAQLAIITTDPSYSDRIGIAPELKPDQLAAVLLMSGAFDIEQVDLEGDFGWFARATRGRQQCRWPHRLGRHGPSEPVSASRGRAQEKREAERHFVLGLTATRR